MFPRSLPIISFFHQVKFIYESFRRLRPGIPLMALYGKQKQLKRVAIYNDFCKKTESVLFATDIAARGLGEYFRSRGKLSFYWIKQC